MIGSPMAAPPSPPRERSGSSSINGASTIVVEDRIDVGFSGSPSRSM